MSRSLHALQSSKWYGDWAPYMHRENREVRQRGRTQRDKDRERIDALQVAAELADAEQELRADVARDRTHARCLAGIELCDECATLEREQWGDYLAMLDDVFEYPHEYDDGRCSCFARCSCECVCGAWAGEVCSCWL